jgi:predicted amidophosphoribosyltransferase
VADELVCGACGAANLAGRKFCGECGAALELPCPSCGAPNPPTVKFCGECGTALTASAPLDEAQELFEHMGARRWLDRIAAVRAQATVTA